MTNKNKLDICDLCRKQQITHYFNYPKVMPEEFYDMFPEERNRTHPVGFKLCVSCMLLIGKDNYN